MSRMIKPTIPTVQMKRTSKVQSLTLPNQEYNKLEPPSHTSKKSKLTKLFGSSFELQQELVRSVSSPQQDKAKQKALKDLGKPSYSHMTIVLSISKEGKCEATKDIGRSGDTYSTCKRN